MKTLSKFAMILAGLLVAGAVLAPPASAGVSFDFFYSNLSPHGHWLVSASNGRVWQPAIYHAGWSPYYDGHWTYTDEGWCWVSDYDWGAVPYHYGTWVMDPAFGWVWVPGYTWAPSWVVFRTGPDYIGWAPVRPGFAVGVSFGFHDYDDAPFVFLPSHAFLCDRVRLFAVPPATTRIAVRRTTIIQNNISIQNNIVVNRGPRVQEVERVTHQRIRPVAVDHVRNVAPGPRFDRNAIRVDNRGGHGPIRAAEPVSAKTPLPARGAGRGEGQVGQRGAERRGSREGRDSSVEKDRNGAGHANEGARPSRGNGGEAAQNEGSREKGANRREAPAARDSRAPRQEPGARKAEPNRPAAGSEKGAKGKEEDKSGSHGNERSSAGDIRDRADRSPATSSERLAPARRETARLERPRHAGSASAANRSSESTRALDRGSARRASPVERAGSGRTHEARGRTGNGRQHERDSKVRGF